MKIVMLNYRKSRRKQRQWLCSATSAECAWVGGGRRDDGGSDGIGHGGRLRGGSAVIKSWKK